MYKHASLGYTWYENGNKIVSEYFDLIWQKYTWAPIRVLICDFDLKAHLINLIQSKFRHIETQEGFPVITT